MRLKFGTFIELWESTQVELHGRYSEERTLDLANYAMESSWIRVLAVLLATPLPCLATTILIDILPLNDPSKGLNANTMFLLRQYCSYLVMNFLCIQQFRTSVRALPYPMNRAVVNTIVMSALCVGSYYVCALAIGFPVPFSTVMVMPVGAVLISTSMAIEWFKKIQETPGAGTMVVNVLKVWACEMLLVLIYPPYYYLFTTLTEVSQMGLALLLPCIKILMRNIFMRTVVHLRDDLPEVVIFNVEVFNALFVSYCMQNSPSFWTTLELMAVDILLLGLSLHDIEVARRGLEELEQRVEQECGWVGNVHSTGIWSARTLERVSRLLQHNNVEMPQALNASRTVSIGPGLTALAQFRQELHPSEKKSLVVMARDACSTFALAPHPLRAAKQLLHKGNNIHPIVDGIEVVPSGKFTPKISAKLSYTRKVRRLLYMAEFVLLLNLVIPLVFSIYLGVVYQLPNRRYYAQLEGMNQDQLFQTLKNVLFYCSLQFISLILLILALRRKLGLSPTRQLGFVLEKQFAGTQIKLVFWVFYNVQASLKHAGYDYSFRFPWLQDHPRHNKHD